MKKNIAVVGGGIAGLTAGYLLSDKYKITMFEKQGRIGGNAYTHVTRTGVSIDMAVASFVQAPNLLKLLNKIKVKVIRRPGAALLSVHDLETLRGFYLTPYSLTGLKSQNFALFRRAVLFTLGNTILMMRLLTYRLDRGQLEGLTMEEVFNQYPKLDPDVITLIMAPLCLLSSMYYDEVMKGPAEYFVGKLKEFKRFEPLHQMFGLRFPANFTRSYVQALAAPYRIRIMLNARIRSIARLKDKVIIRMEDGTTRACEKIIFACNADQALALLEAPTDQEKKLLGAWKYKEGLMVVHKDHTYFPKRELCQSWTCLQSHKSGTPHFSISICGWLLCPGLHPDSEYYATQHPNFPIEEELLDFQKYFRTPIYDFESFKTIKELPSLNGKMNTYYCGSHFGFGLHNDAVTSAFNVAQALGAGLED